MTWRRLEGGTLDPEMTEGLQAAIADPLWLIARQWQVGELTGEDAATPLVVTADIVTRPLSAIHTGERTSARPIASDGPPMEALVEGETVTNGPSSWRVRIDDGALLRRSLLRHGADEQLLEILARQFPLRVPERASGEDPTLARLRLMARNGIDPQALRAALATVGGKASALPIAEEVEPAHRAAFVSGVDDWAAASAGGLVEPDAAQTTWSARRQEYRFGVVAQTPGGPVRLQAGDYPGGTLDWHHFDRLQSDRDPADQDPGAATHQVRVLATPLRYAGMPAARFWEIEDSVTSITDLAGGPDDLARSVIASYAAIAGDDWFVVPAALPAGTIARVLTVTVTDDFGITTTVQSTAAADHKVVPERPWRFFELSGDRSAEQGQTPWLLLPLVAEGVQAASAVEQVAFRRDEMANMAWAIQRRVEGVLGQAEDVDTHVQPPPSPDTDLWTFRLGTAVGDGWLPLVPVRIDAANPQIVLRRGRVAGTSDPTVRAVVLEPGRPLLINEEEIPFGGLRVTRRRQMARSPDGGLHLWVARRKQPGSGPLRRTPLHFDLLQGYERT